MTLAEVMIRLSGARLRALARELGVDNLEDAPDSAVMEIVMDRMAERGAGVDWLVARVPAGELASISRRN